MRTGCGSLVFANGDVVAVATVKLAQGDANISRR